MNAPIALFVYNRPLHTHCVLEYLSKNQGAENSVLYIFSDGAKKDASLADKKKIEEVRRIIRMKQWCKETIIVEEKENKGINLSIITGIGDLVDLHGSLIVLEDDIVTSKYFLNYINASLEKYENDETVMSVNGYMFPLNGKLPETFFLSTGAGWGWATWKRAWSKFNPDAGDLMEQLEKKNLTYKFNFEGSNDYFGMLKGYQNKTIAAWDACWYASVFLQGGLTLYPGKSLTRNIGMDGSGTHYSTTPEKNNDIELDAFIKWAEEINTPELTDRIELNADVHKRLVAFFKNQNNPGLISRIKNKLRKDILTR